MKIRRLRTALTTLGVVIGITAIIGLASLGEGFRVTIREQMEQGFELNVLTVMSGGLLTGVPSVFTDDDVKNMSKIDGVILATPLIQKSGVKLFNEGKTSTPLVLLAVNFSEFWTIYPDRLVFETGSLAQSIENETMVIGYNVEHPTDSESFAYPGQNITVQMTLKRTPPPSIENKTFNLAGTLGKSGAAGFINFDDAIFIPIDTARRIYNITNSDMIFVRLTNPSYADSVAKKIEERFGGEGEVRVLVPAAFLEQVETVLNMVQIFSHFNCFDSTLSGRIRHNEHHDGFSHGADSRDRHPEGDRSQKPHHFNHVPHRSCLNWIPWRITRCTPRLCSGADYGALLVQMQRRNNSEKINHNWN